MDMNDRLRRCIMRRLPHDAERNGVVTLTRDYLISVMSMCWMDGVDDGVSTMMEAREQAYTMAISPTKGQQVDVNSKIGDDVLSE